MNFKPCILVPCYNHSAEFEKFLPELLAAAGNVKIFLIDDGSVPAEAEKLREICAGTPAVEIIRREKNGGKGMALKTGIETALAGNFTHALQIDADGQHDAGEIPRFLKLAEKSPEHAVFGTPVYGNDAPKSRVWGRKITNFWLAVETFSLKMKDGLCGFRVYPLAAAAPLLNKRFWKKRMGADMQILVELYWAGTIIDFYDIRVVYPEGARSHFTPFKSNLAVSLTHTELVIRRILRLLTFKI